LSKHNLQNKRFSSNLFYYSQIPGLFGRRFNIEYIEPIEPAGFPIPSSLHSAYNVYSEAVVVDQLPNNIIQHVRNSNNQELKAALDPNTQLKQNVHSTVQSKTNTLKLPKQPSKVLHHKARPKQKVKQSRPVSSDDSDSTTQTSTSEEETEIKENEKEIIPF
jgi:hypothetical protein